MINLFLTDGHVCSSGSGKEAKPFVRNRYFDDIICEGEKIFGSFDSIAAGTMPRSVGKYVSITFIII